MKGALISGVLGNIESHILGFGVVVSIWAQSVN